MDLETRAKLLAKTCSLLRTVPPKLWHHEREGETHTFTFGPRIGTATYAKPGYDAGIYLKFCVAYAPHQEEVAVEGTLVGHERHIEVHNLPVKATAYTVTLSVILSEPGFQLPMMRFEETTYESPGHPDAAEGCLIHGARDLMMAYAAQHEEKHLFRNALRALFARRNP